MKQNFGGYTLQELHDAQRYAKEHGSAERLDAIETEIALRTRKHGGGRIERQPIVLRTLLGVVVLVQILGGLQGIIMVVNLPLQHAVEGPYTWQKLVAVAITTLFLAVFVVSVIAGVQLARARVSGYRLSILTQAVQVLYFKAWYIQYICLVGGGLLVNLVPLSVDYQLRFESEFTLMIGPTEPGLQIGVNTISLGALAILGAYRELANGRGRGN